MEKFNKKTSTKATIVGAVAVALILIFGNLWLTYATQRDTEKAVSTVSQLYLNELADRREQVVENNLKGRINDIRVAIDLMSDEDLSDKSHMEAYQKRIKKTYHLERFAFVDQDGLIYTSTGTQKDIDKYPFNYKEITKPEISILDIDSKNKKVIIAVPVNIKFQGNTFSSCFMQIAMEEMLAGVSMNSQAKGATYCNMYTKDGIALTNKVLGGLAAEDNLLVAMKNASFNDGYSYKTFLNEFKKGKSGQVSFTYNDIHETLKYVSVKGTDWLLTYLVRESVISEKISSVSRGMVMRNILQSMLLIAAMVIMFAFIISQNRKNTRLVLEQEKTEAENRIRQQDMEERLALQEQLLAEEQQRTQQDKLITAMAVDYLGVYYVDLDHDDAICYRNDKRFDFEEQAGKHFAFSQRIEEYCSNYVGEQFKEGLLDFIRPENIRRALENQPVISYRYIETRDSQETYVMLRIARVTRTEETGGHIGAVAVVFGDIDEEMRTTMAHQQMLSDALTSAEQASKAKTAFLSSMSHELRTPMNAIIGLDNIALNDPETPEKTKEYLEKIGSSADYLLNLINDILDMSRIESGRMTLKNEEFSFSKLLENINTMFSGPAADNDLEYHCRIDSDIDEFYIGDNVKLRQVLVNILGNAVKFTPAGGKVELAVKRKARFRDKTSLTFSISDTGIGMSEEFLPTLFDAFSQEDSSTTTKHGSSGLGMAITKNIVEMMNGHIEVESEKGKGTTFFVTVTLSNSEKKGSSDYDEFEFRPADMKVLVVDDDPIACEHAKLVLEKAGIASEYVLSGAEAVRLAELHHTRREPYNLILIDWKMPEMDGLETSRKIREITGEETGIIILTAYKWDDIVEEGTASGVDSFVSKPLFARTVLDEFRSAMMRKGGKNNNGPKKTDLTGKKILIAEDVAVNAEIMQMVLKMRDVETDIAENGKLAVEAFTRHEPGYYSAILMDIRMPEMDGLEATKKIREMDRTDASEIPIIALTANAFDEDVQHSLQAGMNAHLSKPVQPEILFETLESLIKD